MFVKNLGVAFLLDFYGALLSERPREMLEMYYCDDLSLAEISANVGISRQGVRQAIKKGEEELFSFEDKLGLAARHVAVKEAAEKLAVLASSLENADGPLSVRALAEETKALAEQILYENQQ